MEENGAGVVVKYARAHEYMRGTPQMYEEHHNNSNKVSYLWLDPPSETVYYFVRVREMRDDPSFPPLMKWTSKRLELIEESSIRPNGPNDRNSTTTDTQPPRLRPASRYICQPLPWSHFSTIRVPSFFSSIKEDVRHEIKTQLELPTVDRELGAKLELESGYGIRLEQPLSSALRLKLVPQTLRSATLRLEHKKEDGKEDKKDGV